MSEQVQELIMVMAGVLLAVTFIYELRKDWHGTGDGDPGDDAGRGGGPDPSSAVRSSAAE